MRVKSILSLTVFITAFLTSAVLASFFAPEIPASAYGVRPVRTDQTMRQRIKNFLETDVRNGVERDRRIWSLQRNSVRTEEYAATRVAIVNQYVSQSSSMDESQLPQDLQVAWLKHMRAWHNYTDYLEEHSDYDSEASRLNHEISVTWYEVLSVGEKYGAVIQDY